MGQDVEFQFGADIKDVKEKLDQMGGLFKAFGEQFAAVAAIVGGGAAFKKFIDETVTLNSEALKLSKILGITGDAAGSLNTALGDIGADAETYTGAFLHFNRSLRQNADEMKSMGVDIAGLRSGQKSSNEVFVQALAIFGQYAPGIDQTQAAMKMFGRSVEDVQKLQRLTNEVTNETAKRLGQSREELNATLTPLQKYNANMETAAEKNKALNLNITQEGMAASRAYKESMNEVGDVMAGVSKTIGEAVMPHFTKLAEQLSDMGPIIVQGVGAAIQIMITLWDELADIASTVWDGLKSIFTSLLETLGVVFGREGPGAMELFKNSIKVVQIAIQTFSAGIQQLVVLVSTGVQEMVSWFRTLADVADAVLSGKGWDGVKAAWQKGIDDRVKIVEEGAKKIADIGRKWQEKVEQTANASLGIPAGTAAGAPKGGTKKMPIGKNTGDDPRLGALLALQRAQQDAALRLQLEYLKQAGDIYDTAYKHNLISVQQYYDAKLAIEQAANETELGTRRRELADAQAAEAKAQSQASSSVKSDERRKHEADVLKFRTEQAKIQGQINVLEAQSVDITRKNTQERADAQRDLDNALGTIAATRAKANADAEVTNLRGALDQMRSLREINAQQQFDAERALENRSYEAQRAFLATKRSQILNDDKKALAQQAADEEAAEVAHQQKLTEIDRSAQLERAKYSIQAQQSVQDAFAGFLKSLMTQQKSLMDALRAFGLQVAQIFEELIAKRFAERLFGEGTAGGQLIDKLVGPVISAIESIVVKWVGAEAAQTAATAAESAARTAFRQSEIAAQTASQVAGIAEVKAASISEVMSYASVAAAAAMASVAAIPVVGWAMAPGVGAETYATAMGFLATAKGGWDSVPFDGAMAQLHKEEMVLPRFLSEGMRQMAEPGRLQAVVAGAMGNAARPAAGDNYHFTVQAVDAQSVKRLFDQHGDAIVSSLVKQVRNFAGPR